MHDETYKPNWLFRGLIVLSVGVHLVVLIRVTAVHHPKVASRIELTLQSMTARPQHRIVAPPARLEQPQDVIDRQPHLLQVVQNSAISAPQYHQPKPLTAERLKKLRPLPSMPDNRDPVATVWEEAPGTMPISVAPAPAPIKPETGLDEKHYTDRIKQRIEAAKKYPQRARRRSIEGVVKVLFTIGGRGELISISISSSSGSRILDRSAIKAVQKAAPFDAPPSGSITLELPIKYRLTRS